jgi:nucleoside-diphosphate-sugar epimerase
VDDVVNYVYLTKSISNSIINLNFNINYKVLDIWQEVENVLGKKGKSRIIDAGYDYKVDNSLFISKLREVEIPELNDKDYLRRTINKYINLK